MDLIQAVRWFQQICKDSVPSGTGFTVAFCGVFSSGKSSLINALLNADGIAYQGFTLPVGDFPITKIVTRICYGPMLKFYYLDEKGEQAVPIPEAQFKELVTGKAVPSPEYPQLLVELPSPLLQNGVAFVDTPGFLDEMGGELERVSRKAVLGADFVVFCTNAAVLGHQFEREYLDELDECIGNYYLVVNRMDSCNTSDDRRAIYQKTTFLMRDRTSAFLDELANQSCFFTIASGPRKNLDRLDHVLYELLETNLVRRNEIKKHSRQKAAQYQKKMLALQIQFELESLEEKLEQANRNHQKALAQIQQKNDLQRLKTIQECAHLKNLLQARLDQTAENLYQELRVLVQTKDVHIFMNICPQIITSRYLKEAKAASDILGPSGQGIDQEFEREIQALSLPQPQRIILRRRGFLERAYSAGKKMYSSSLWDPRMFKIEDQNVYGYAEYGEPVINAVRQNLHPRLSELLMRRVDAYKTTLPLPEQTGLETEIAQLEEQRTHWLRLLQLCQ